MKKLIVLTGAMMLLCHTEAKAEKGVYLSSVSATNNSRGDLCAGGRGFLKRVCVVDGVASSTAAVYATAGVKSSSNTLTGNIDASETGKGCSEFDLSSPQGLYRDNWGTASVVVIYECY